MSTFAAATRPDHVRVHRLRGDAPGQRFKRGPSHTNVTVQTGAGVGRGDITIKVNTKITRNTGGDATLRLNAHNNIIAENETRIESLAGRLNVEFNSDSDANGSGAISLGTLTIQTNGGDVRMFGGGNADAGRARGNPDLPNGVSLRGTRIDTIPSAGGAGGDVRVLGQGEQLDLKLGRGAGHGISLTENVEIKTGSGNLTLDGVGGSGVGGVGVLLDGASLLASAGTVTLTGRGSSPGELPQLPVTGGDGVRLQRTNADVPTSITTTSGAIVISGEGGAGGDGQASAQPGGGGEGVTINLSSLQSGAGSISITGVVGGKGGNGVEGTGPTVAGGGGGVGGLGVHPQLHAGDIRRAHHSER